MLRDVDWGLVDNYHIIHSRNYSVSVRRNFTFFGADHNKNTFKDEMIAFQRCTRLIHHDGNNEQSFFIIDVMNRMCHINGKTLFIISAKKVLIHLFLLNSYAWNLVTNVLLISSYIARLHSNVAR